jgi:hypothetical protein
MATSFKGWGGSWLDAWGPVNGDPNAMVGHASITFTAALQVASGEMQGSASFRIDAAGFVRSSASPEPPKYYSAVSEKEKAFMRQIRDEDDVILALIQQFVMEEA